MTATARCSDSLHAAVEQFVIDQGCVTSKLVAERFNRTPRTAQRILAALRDAKRVKGGRVRLGAHQPAIWTFIDKELSSAEVDAIVAAEADELKVSRPSDGLPVVLQVAATAWRRGEAHRHPMDTAFFGPAPAERIAA